MVLKKGLGGNRLFFAYFLSVVLHVFFLIEGGIAIFSLGDAKMVSHPIFASLKTKKANPYVDQASESLSKPSISALEKKLRDYGDESGGGGLPPSAMVFGEGDLDQALAMKDEPLLEPAYGFGDDVAGSVSLSLLVGDTGNVVWVFVESTELDESSTRYVVEGFRRGRFSVPIREGKPVMAIFNVEVLVGESKRKAR